MMAVQISEVFSIRLVGDGLTSRDQEVRKYARGPITKLDMIR